MKATVKQIFSYISDLNPEVSTISSLGNYISDSDRVVSERTHNECVSNVSENSLAKKILTSNYERLTDKQLWVIAFELEKNEGFSEKVGRFYAEIEAKTNESKSKKAANKEGSQSVLDLIKSNGRKLADYYDFVKSTKRYKSEFYSKKFSIESANEFLNK